MQQDISSLEKHIKKELSNHKVPYDSKSWKSLKTKLPKHSYKNWYWAVAIIVGVLSISTYLFENNTIQKNNKNTLAINRTKKTVAFIEKKKGATPNIENKKNTITPKKQTTKKKIPKKLLEKNEETKKFNNLNTAKKDSSFLTKTLLTEKINNPITNWDIASINIQQQALCSSSPIYFSIINLPENTKVFWDFGDNNTTTTYNNQHIYKEAGEYKIKLKIYNSTKQINLEKIISVKESPKASFYYEQEKNNLTLNNTSKNFTKTKWIINEKHVVEDSLYNVFTNTGKYTIQLIVENQHQCFDSYKKVVNYKKDYEVYAPTAFVPNNDGINDEYMVKYKILENYSYNFQIFNNLGVLIFESSEPAASWNGLIGNKIAPKGKYLWKLTITDPQKKIEQYDDYFILIRKN